jgi:hypothetical protein
MEVFMDALQGEILAGLFLWKNLAKQSKESRVSLA